MRVCVSGVAAALTVLLISTPAAAQAPSAARVVRLTGTLPDAIETTAPVLRFAVYDAEAGFKAHQETAHYLKWKETVAEMMAAPRVAEKHENLFPKPWA